MSRHDFPSEEFADRRARLFAAMQRRGLDWLLILHPTSIHWLTGSEAKSYQSFQCLVADRAGERLTMLVREAERIEFTEEALVDDARFWGRAPADPMEAFSTLARDLGVASSRAVGIELPAYYLHPLHHAAMLAALSHGARDATAVVGELRVVKSPAEIAYLREAARIADLAMTAVAGALAPGRTELEVAAALYHAVMSAGGEPPAVPPNLSAGTRSAYSHGAPTQRRLAAGDFGNAEFCVPYRRHTVSLGRQFALGEPTPRMAELHRAVVAAADAAIARIRNGALADEPFHAATGVLREAGLESHRAHTIGYTVASAFPPATGDFVQLVPNGTELRTGMLLSVCPNVFIGEERLGARIAQNVLVTDGGCEILSALPTAIIVA